MVLGQTSVAIASEEESEGQALRIVNIVSFYTFDRDLRSKASNLDEVSLDKTKDLKIKDLLSDKGTKFPNNNY